MTTDTLPLAGSLLIAIQHGPLVTVRINGCKGEIVMGVDKWLALRAMGDVLGAADKRHAEDQAEIERLSNESRWNAAHAKMMARAADTEKNERKWERRERMRLDALRADLVADRDSLRSTIDALKQECERMRGMLAREHACYSARSHSDTIGMGAGYLRCQHNECLATIDVPLVASSAWTVDARGWWFCPAHVSRERAKEESK